jgi:hypothetical protein
MTLGSCKSWRLFEQGVVVERLGLKVASGMQAPDFVVVLVVDHVVSFYVGAFERLPVRNCCFPIALMTSE